MEIWILIPLFPTFNLSKMDVTCDGHIVYGNHLNLDLKMISISDLSYQFTKH